MAFLLSLGLFALLMSAISYFGYRRYARPARVYEQLGGQANFAMPTFDKISEADPGLAVWVVEQVGEKVPIDPEGAAALRRDLMAAGYRSERALPIYLGSRVLTCALLVIAALLFRNNITSNAILSVVIP